MSCSWFARWYSLDSCSVKGCVQDAQKKIHACIGESLPPRSLFLTESLPPQVTSESLPPHSLFLTESLPPGDDTCHFNIHQKPTAC